MTYTSHGHYIEGSAVDPDQVRPRIHRCGGPGLCGKCSAEQARVLDKQREKASRSRVEQWRRKSYGVQAIPVGPNEGDIPNFWGWISTHPTLSHVVPAIDLVLEGFPLRPGHWVVISEHDVDVLTDKDFHEQYELDV